MGLYLLSETQIMAVPLPQWLLHCQAFTPHVTTADGSSHHHTIFVMPHPVFVNRRQSITSFFRTDSQSLPTMSANRIIWLEADNFPSSQNFIFLLSHNHSSIYFPLLLLSLCQVQLQVWQVHLCSHKASTKGVH